MLHAFLSLIALLVASDVALGQSGNTLSFDPHAGSDKAPWISARAAGMSEAISPVANGQEAPYYNPAAIGGLNYKQAQGAVSGLYFPYLGAAADPSSISLNQKLREGRNLQDPTVAEELLRAYDGDHPYARFSLLPSITFYRMFIGYVYDVRAASTPTGEGSDGLEVDYRSQSGPMLGFSIASPKRDFYLGISGGFFKRTETQGNYPLATLIEANDRKTAFSANEKSYSGAPLNVGSIYNINARWRPSFSLVAKNLMGTTYRSTDENVDAYKDREELTLGFGLSPNLGKWGMLNLVWEGTDLTRRDRSATEKMRFGSELTFGNGFGSESIFALRLGYRKAGASFGAGFNLGMLGVQFASYAEDIGIEGSSVIERRSMVNIGINIAD